MRRIISSGSVKGIYLDRDEVLEKLKKVCEIAIEEFPNIKEILLFGSFAKGEIHGLSDIDLIIVEYENKEKDPFKRIKPYFSLFSEYLDIPVDIIVIEEREKSSFEKLFKEIKTLCHRKIL